MFFFFFFSEETAKIKSKFLKEQLERFENPYKNLERDVEQKKADEKEEGRHKLAHVRDHLGFPNHLTLKYNSSEIWKTWLLSWDLAWEMVLTGMQKYPAEN